MNLLIKQDFIDGVRTFASIGIVAKIVRIVCFGIPLARMQVWYVFLLIPQFQFRVELADLQFMLGRVIISCNKTLG